MIKRIAVVLVFLSPVLVFFVKLGNNALIEFDEGIYALVSKRMVENGNLLVLNWQEGIPWFDKGPLYFWLSSPLLNIFGYSALMVRFWSAFLGLLTVYCLFLIGKKLTDSSTGILAMSIISSTIGFVYYGRLGMLDVPNAFFNTLSVLLLIYSRSSRKYLYLTSVVLALGFLNRGPLVFMGAISYVIYCLLLDRNFFRAWKDLLFSVLLFISVAAPWHIIMTVIYGKTFIETYFGHQMFSRFTQTIEGKGAPVFWYISVIRTQFRIWFALLLIVTPVVFFKLTKVDRPTWIFLIWSFVTFSVFSLSQSKLIWYIMPIYPPLALLLAQTLRGMFGKIPKVLPLFILIMIFLAAVYDWRLRDRILTEDYNHDLVKVVKESNKYLDRRYLLSINYGYSVMSFYSQKSVKGIPLPELPALLNEQSLAVVSATDLGKVTNLAFRFKELYRYGNVVLIEKED